MDGISIEFISQDRLQEQSFEEKLKMILGEVREDKILVLEEALSPEEEARLIQEALEHVDEDFPGIEFSGLESTEDAIDRMVNNFYNLIGRKRRRGITVVGNSDVMQTVKKEKGSISLLARAQQNEE